MRQRAPAKINLGLRILGRRPDGYHLLESIFLPLGCADELEVGLDPARPGRVQLVLEGAPESVPSDGRNLAVRAARAFRSRVGEGPGISIRLRKRVPAAAGLGGGSSDAGAVLRALERLEPGRLGPRELARLALELGADVPFFLDPRPARVTGVGERIEPLAGLRALPLLLAWKGPGLSTRTVFEAYRRSRAPADSLTPRGSGPTIGALWPLREDGGLVRAGVLLRELVRNDLEPVATSVEPAVAELRREIEESGALVAGMSGSGPTVYGLFGDEAGAQAAARRIRQRSGAEVRVTHTLPSP